MPIRRTAAVMAAISVGIAGTLTGCTGDPGERPVAGVPTIGILTDQASEAGAAAIQAATLAVGLVNEVRTDIDLPLAASAGVPGLAGVRVELAVGDTTGQPARAEAAMDQLLGANPAGVIAADSAEVIAIAGAYADRRRVPLVDAASSAGFLLEVGLDWYFRVAPSDRTLAEAVFALLASEPAPSSPGGVTVLTAGAGTGAGVVASLPELASGWGLEISAVVAVDEQAPLELAQTAPDPVVAVASTVDEAQRVLQVVGDSGGPRPVIGIGGGFVARPGIVPAGMLYPAGWSSELAQRHPLAGAVMDLYQERYETAMTGTAAAVFTATLVLAMAVDAARATDPATVRAGLRQLSIPATQMIMPWNGLQFGDDGQNELAAAVVEQRTGAGSVLVYPRELAVTDVSWPSPSPPPSGESVP